MLSIGTLTAGQAGYYERQVAKGRDDYYSGKGEAPGQWLGRGAAAMGLDGRVEATQFNAMMTGADPRDPDLERPLRQSKGEVKTVGFDLTFSAPKSVSVLFAVADDQVSGQLVAAHEAAVEAALDYVQDEATKVRRGKGGAEVHDAASGLLAAAYRHRMSRAKDPQLHTHVVCANAAEGPDGRWTALDGRHLFRHAKTAGFLYQAHLRAEVVERLGLEWGPVTKGAAELTAVEPEVLSEFSRRRHEMLRAAEAAGIEDLASARGEYIALESRDPKTYDEDSTRWRENARARAAEHGLTTDALARLAVGAGERPTLHIDQARELGDELAGPSGLTEKANAFGQREVLQAHAAGAAQGASVSVVRGRGQDFGTRADVLATVAGELTTQDLVATERRLIAAAVGRAGATVAVVDPDRASSSLARADRCLSDEQQAAVRSVVTSGNGVDVIEALAGTGKTYTAGALRQVYEDAGYRVIGIAPTGRAVRGLAEEAGLPSWTMARTLMDLEHTDDGLGRDMVIVLDEAGMAATRQTEQILAAAEQAGAKVVAIGDSGQLASVQAGGWMTAVAEQIGGGHQLTEVRRQRDAQERRALARLHAGDPNGYLTWAIGRERIAIHTTTADGSPLAAALADWQTAVEQSGLAQAVLIARNNDTRAALNDAARQLRREAGALGEEQHAFGPLTVSTGDRVICRRNDRLIDVDNGTRGTVRAASEAGLVIDTDAGTVRELPARYVAEHLEPAYCLTGHGMQGGTVDAAVVVASPRELTRGWSYTALSRARAVTRLHIDGRADASPTARERAEIAPADSVPVVDRDRVLAQTALAMLQRDDEDLAVSQLPARAPTAGRADDPQLRDARVAGAEHPEHVASRAEPVSAGPSHEELPQLLAERVSVSVQRESLPLRELTELDRLGREAGQVTAQRADIARRLELLPEPTRRLGRTRYDHAAERARLRVAIDAADQQLAALDQRAAQLLHAVGSVDELRQEREGLDRHTAELDRRVDRQLDRLADHDVAHPPEWATKALGERPVAPRQAEQYDRAIRAVARYRIEHDLADGVPDVGPEPHDRNARRDHREARSVLEQVQRRLGRGGRERDRGVER